MFWNYSTSALLLHFLVGLPVGLLAANFGEWIIHKRLLHHRGRNRRSFWAFHWHDHHKASRKHGMYDPAYLTATLLAWNSRTKEAAALAFGVVAHIPVFLVAPGFATASWISTVVYYVVHKKAHESAEWARRYLPWHVDHHLGPDQDKNWCVTHPLADYVLGTRERYVGTERESRDIARKTQRAA